MPRGNGNSGLRGERYLLGAMGILLLVVALVVVSAVLAKVGLRFFRGHKPRPVQEMQDDTSGR